MTVEHSFPYQEASFPKSPKFPTGLISRPYALVELKDDHGKLLPVSFLVDSGADVTLLPLSIGTYLGRDVLSGESFRTYGIGRGSLNTRLHEVEAVMGKSKFSMTVAFAEVDDIDGRPVPALLGRTSVFDSFDVLFKQRKSQITFSSAPE